MSAPDPRALTALARSRAYALLADLHGRGLRAETVPAWLEVEGGILSPAQTIDLDATEEAWTRLYLLELPAIAGAFLSPDGLVGGEAAADVRALRAAAGLADPVGMEVEHLSATLGLLAFLCGAEADARRDGVVADRLVALQHEVLAGQLLRWLPSWVAALRGVCGPGPTPPADATYLAGAELTLALAVDHSVGAPTPGDWLPAPVSVLDEPGTGLRRIAEHLVLPSQAGGYLSRGVILRVARSLELPATFGDRADLLEGLLCAAAQYTLVPKLALALDTVWAGWDAALAAEPEWAVRPWRRRIVHTRSLLRRLEMSPQQATFPK